MTEHESEILSHYNLRTADPTEWPADKNQSDESGDEAPKRGRAAQNHSRRKSRYSALEESNSNRRSYIPGSEKTDDGKENLVQTDEPDPLGGSETVVRALKQRGVPVEDNRSRNRFLTSSTSFSPALFLSEVHYNDTTQTLLQGLDFLSRSIDQKSASLKILVENNFERFVRAKSTIDNVYTEMRNRGVEAETTTFPHSHSMSRSSMHFRTMSNSIPNDRKPKVNARKNALVKESEYGVQGIKAPLVEVSVKADEIWGPALGGKEREKTLKHILDSIEKHHGVYEVAGALSRSIRQKNYDQVVEEYAKARRYKDEAATVANKAVENGVPLTDPQIYHVILAGRMWLDVDQQIEALKRDVWRKLTVTQTSSQTGSNGQAEEYMDFISLLLELGVEDNPIWVWLLSRYDYLKTKITTSFERARIEIEILRRRLAELEPPDQQVIASHLRSCDQRAHPELNDIDTSSILEFWARIHSLVYGLLSIRTGVLGEVISFWEIAKGFIDGKKQKTLPIGFDGQSRKHHQISADGVRDLNNGALELVELMRGSLYALFAEPPVEDISSLFVSKQGSATASKALKSRTTDPRFKFDLNNLPPPSPRKGEAWEDFAFWPPHSNSVSGVKYLSKLLVLLGTAASEMAAIGPVTASGGTFEKLRALVSGTRERCIRAICAAWNRDAESCKVLEDWSRSIDRPDLTKMPSHFLAFESDILLGMQKVLYISEAVTKPGLDIISPPPTKLLQLVRSQFVTSLYKALSGMVEKAERVTDITDDESSIDIQSQYLADAINIETEDSKGRNVRMLLTLSNLKALRTEIVPQLINTFENSFSVQLTEESKTIRDVLGQIDARLFQMYTGPTLNRLSSAVTNGIKSDSFIPNTTRPTEVSAYVYEVLLLLVKIHTEVSTTADSLTTEILSFLLEQVSITLLDGLKLRPKYSLAGLMQATLDSEFIAQTLRQYTTDKATEYQNKIYLELDRRTSNDARMNLQDELPDMKTTLKSLRDKTRNEFACFKASKSRKDRQDRPQS